jgi:hypothetical protein
MTMHKLALISLAAALAFTTSAAAVDFRWNQGFGQGTLEASIQNREGATFSVSCPAGSDDTTPSLDVRTKMVPMPKGKVVDVQVIVDGKNHPFNLIDGSYLGAGRSFRQDIENVVNALRKSKGKTFDVEYPMAGKKDTFSLQNARTALGAGKASILSGC